jgi:hypothetical protein
LSRTNKTGVFLSRLNKSIMDILNPMTYDAEEDKLRERTKYSQMDRLLLPVEFQQQPVSTGVSY